MVDVDGSGLKTEEQNSLSGNILTRCWMMNKWLSNWMLISQFLLWIFLFWGYRQIDSLYTPWPKSKLVSLTTYAVHYNFLILVCIYPFCSPIPVVCVCVCAHVCAQRVFPTSVSNSWETAVLKFNSFMTVFLKIASDLNG